MDRILLAKAVVEIAKKAGAEILKIYENEADFGIEQKADDSPLTKADRAANEVICHGLEALSLQYPIVSEENKAIPYTERKHYSHSWLVDPLDGTKEFIKRNGEFTVNIALIENQQPVLGVVYAPDLNEMYWAVKDHGAFLVENGKDRKLAANTFTLYDAGLRVVCSRSHLNKPTQDFVDQLTNPELVATGSSLKFLIMAKGQADVYPRLGPTMEWDTGAAQIILEEAGGSVIDEVTKEPLLYNKENLLNPYFIAYGKKQEPLP